jgi:DNA repair exonuclease SbcCD nuclease subunit
MFSFLHAADIHLDSPLRGLDRYEGAPVEALRGSTRDALSALVDLAVEEKVAFVLIAGDLYDGNWKDHGTGLFFHAQAARLRDHRIPLFLIRGNHDAQSKLTKSLSLPDNVHVLSADKAESLPVENVDVLIHGRSFARQAETDNLALSYPDKEMHAFNIGLLHTCATGREGHDRYAPCTVDELRRKGYDYWALGHIHKREILCDDPPIVFPGNIQGRHALETGAKGCSLVTVDDSGDVRIEHRVLDVLRWTHCRVDATGAARIEELVERAGTRLAEERAGADGRLLAARIEITGTCKAHDRAASRPEQVEAEMRGWVRRELGPEAVWVEKIKLRTRSPRPVSDGDGPLSVFLGLLSDLRADDDRLRQLADDELADLRKKLRSETRADDDLPDLDAMDLLRDALEHAGALVIDGLVTEDGLS